MSFLSKQIDIYLSKKILNFHSPAHSGKENMRDLTELTGLDCLEEPFECIAKTQSEIALHFGAASSHMLINGASQGLQVALLALRLSIAGTHQNNKPILLARNVHKSVINGLVLTGFDIEWLYPAWDEDLCMFTRVDLSAIDFDKYSGIVLTNPTYEGFYSQLDLSSCPIPVIVDEAHGAHYDFSDQLPKPALKYGADIAVQSWHKCLGSLTQTGVLHVGMQSKIKTEFIQQALRTLQSTSPSYILLESISKTFEELKSSGQERFTKILELCNEINLDSKITNDDPLRLVFQVTGMSGEEIMDRLEEDYKIAIESHGINTALAFINYPHTKDDLHKLTDAINDLSHAGLSHAGRKFSSSRLQALPSIAKLDLRENLRPARERPRDAFFGAKQKVQAKDALGKISAELYAPCPPGIAVLVPGMEIDEWALSLLPEDKEVEICL